MENMRGYIHTHGLRLGGWGWHPIIIMSTWQPITLMQMGRPHLTEVGVNSIPVE